MSDNQAAERLVRVDQSQYPDEFECRECGGVAVYDGGNWGTWTCRDCLTSWPREEAERVMGSNDEP